MNQPIMMGPMGPIGPAPLIRQNAVPNLYMPTQNKKTNPIIGIVVVLILCIIIWLVFLKKNSSYSEWSEWSTCDKECGGGQQIRKREYIPAKWGGTDLTDKNPIIEYQDCNKDPCPINGYYSEWGEWNKCSKECGGGEQSRTRTYNLAQFGGIDISKNDRILNETRECNTNICPGDPANVSDWTDITNNKNNIIYKDNNGKEVDINAIDPIDFENKDFKIYKEQKRIFTKEGSNYIGEQTLEKILKNLLDKKEIRQQEYDNLKINGGSQIKKSDIDKANLKFKAHLKIWTDFNECNPEKGTDRWRKRNTFYYFPTGNNGHDEYFTNELGFTGSKWNEIKNLKKGDTITVTSTNNTFIITRVNNEEPKKYKVEHNEKCDNVPYYTIDDLSDLWKLETIAGCTTNFNEEIITNVGGNTLEDYSYSKSGSADLENLIKNTWSKTGIIKGDNPRKKITQCYGDNYTFEVTPEMHRISPKKNILQSGFTYTWKGSTSKDHFEWFTPNNKIKLVFQYDGHLILRGNITDSNKEGKIIWINEIYERSENWKGKWTLQMQFDGNLAIRNGRDQVWSTNTYNNPGAYAELSDNGSFIIKNKDNKNICYILRKRYGNKNLYFSDDNNWKYCKNNNSTDGILKDWSYYDKDGKEIEYIGGRVTLKNKNQPWGMTEKNTTDDERSKSGMIEPIKIPQVFEENPIVHVVLMNKLGQRIYIEPQILLEIYNEGDKDNNINKTIKCDDYIFNAVNAYNIDKNDFINNIDKNDFINKLQTSSYNLTDGLFRNEWGRGVREPYRFNKELGAPHDNDKNLKIEGCTPFYALYTNGRYVQFKDPLKADGFQEARVSNINWPENWLRDPRGRGSSRYSYYWRVYYRTINDYVNYLNSQQSPDAPAAFTNKSIFTNKCINDLEYFVNYRINQKNKSNFSNKLNNAYLEAIM